MVFLSKHKGWLWCTGPHLMNSFSQPQRWRRRHLCGWLKEGRWKTQLVRRGEMNKWKPRPSWALQPTLFPSSVIYFSPSLRCWALDHFSFPSPLHSTQFCHPAKETNQRALSLSLHIFPLFHSAFLCLCPLIVWSATSCPPPMMSYVRSNGCWELTWGQMNCVLLAILRVVNCSFLPLRKVLPLFRESVSCFKNSVHPFKLIQSGSPSLYFCAKIIWCVCTRQLSCYWTCYLYP